MKLYQNINHEDKVESLSLDLYLILFLLLAKENKLRLVLNFQIESLREICVFRPIDAEIVFFFLNLLVCVLSFRFGFQFWGLNPSLELDSSV